MARKETVRFVDDLDGGEASGSVGFGLDGKQYEIDLSDANAAKLRDALAPFIAAGRRVANAGGKRAGRSTSGGSRPSSDREHNQAVRDWARGRGMKVSERGRIPSEVLDAYAQENGAAA